MMINRAVLHIIDFNSNICLLSQRAIDIRDNEICMFLTRHIEHIQADGSQKRGSFKDESLFMSWLQEYILEKMSFIDFSSIIANKYYDGISSSDKLDSCDLIIIDFTHDDITHIALLALKHKDAYTHQVINDEGGIYNKIIKHHSILPSTSQKIDSYAVVRCNDFSVGFADKKRMINGQDVFVLPEYVLQSTSMISSKEAIKAVHQIATKIAEEHGENTAVTASKTKNFLMSNAEISSSFSPIELGREVFADSKIMQNEFEALICESELPSNIQVEKSLVKRMGRNHKIKTDTGIELSFPVEYYENHQFIEFINNPNGTISIAIKNIGKIINR